MEIRNDSQGRVLVKVLDNEMDEGGSFDVPDDIVSIDIEAFMCCTNLKRAKLFDNLNFIGNGAFSDCVNMEQIDIPDSVTWIDSFAFRNCEGLKKVNLGTGLQSIGDSAFNSCENLTEITLSEGIRWIGSAIFAHCKRLKKINLPMSLNSIPAVAFENCIALEEIDIPQGVNSIGSMAFQNCTALKQISIPESILSIAPDAFSNTGLETIFIDSTDEKERARIISLLPDDLKEKVVIYSKSELLKLLRQELYRIIDSPILNPLYPHMPFLIHAGLPYLPHEILVKINENLGSANLHYQNALTAIKAIPLPKAQTGEEGKRSYELKIKKIINDCLKNGEAGEEINSYSFLLKVLTATAVGSGLAAGLFILVAGAVPVSTTVAVASASGLTAGAGSFFYHALKPKEEINADSNSQLFITATSLE